MSTQRERAARFWHRLVDLWDAAPDDDVPSDEIFELIQAFKAGVEEPPARFVREPFIAFAAGMRLVGAEWPEIAERVKVPLAALQPKVERWLEDMKMPRPEAGDDLISKESLHREGLHNDKPMKGCRLCQEQR